MTRLSLVLLVLLSGALLPGTAGGAPAVDAPQVIRFHGRGYDRAEAMAVDDAGYSYVGGAVDGDGEVTFAVVKTSPSGAVLWRALYDGSLGGSGGSALAVTLDAAGNVYAAGSIGDGTFYPNFDYLVVAFDRDGRQRWAQRYDGPGPDNHFDRATEIAVDASGVYVSGTSYSLGPDFTFDWSTQKYSLNGDRLWERRHKGTGTFADRVADMVLAPDGNVVVTGFTSTEGDHYSDVGVVTYDPNGSIVWADRWSDGVGSDEHPRDMAVDAAGRITITGTVGLFAPSSFAVRYDHVGTLLQTIRGDGGASVDVDAGGNIYLIGAYGHSVLARYDASGARTWATSVTIPSDESFGPLFGRVDSTGAVTVGGTISKSFNADYLVVRFAPDGRELWRYRFDGPVGGDDRVAAVAIDGSDAALVTGTSWNDYLSNRGGTADDLVTLRFPAGAAPALVAPTDLAAKGISRSQIQLNWADHGGTEDGFQIERCAGNGCREFTQVATLGHDVTVYIDGGLTRNTRYSYRVRAFKGAETSAYSNVATGKTQQQ